MGSCGCQFCHGGNHIRWDDNCFELMARNSEDTHQPFNGVDEMNDVRKKIYYDKKNIR